MTDTRKQKRIAVWGATGSIGRQTLEVIDRYPDRYRVSTLTARENGEALLAAALAHGADGAVLTDEDAARRWHDRFKSAGIRLLSGREGLLEAAADPSPDIVVNGLVGSVGLEATLLAIDAGCTIALANKEVLVMAGELVMAAAARRGVALLPVDSEHSALFQCLQGEKREQVARLILTASGGPFRSLPADKMAAVSVHDALAHPNWSMGPKVTVDSATMVNKGLEVIEARWLFDLDPDRITVVVHPQSIVHAMVAFSDGSVKAQLSRPDMRLPIAYALTWPDRGEVSWGAMDFSTALTLDFQPPDLNRFPGLALAFEALRTGGTAPAVLNAADEAAVSLFLNGTIGFMDIPRLIEKALAGHVAIRNPDLETILATDREIRARLLND
ncbi:1-deoxy-D-xylulose-5-phosphate reductoisomerase [bacterium]|nr:1-deoxy-D-xylulose-5-phosphate reductoisomerase [bacterium]